MKSATKHPKRKYFEAAAYIVLIAAFSAKAFTDGLSPPSRGESFDPITSMLARSPGKRTTGELAKAKLSFTKKPLSHAKVASRVVRATSPRTAVAKPAQTGSFRTPLGSPLLPIINSPALIAAIASPSEGFPIIDAVNSDAPPSGVGGGIGGGGGGFAVLPGGGGGGGTVPPGGGGDIGVPPIDVLPLPAVPEPTTWAMMIIGFFVIGRMLRKHRNPQPTQPSVQRS